MSKLTPTERPVPIELSQKIKDICSSLSGVTSILELLAQTEDDEGRVCAALWLISEQTDRFNAELSSIAVHVESLGRA
jgi:hypothetical protein